MADHTPEEIESIKKSGLFFVGLDKLVRGIKLYEGKGTLVDQLLKDLHTRSQELFTKEITYKITPVGPMLFSEPLCEEGKNPHYLFQLYCDGVRELSFLPSLSKKEIMALSMTFYGEGVSEQDDFVTALWKREFKGIRYYAVDTLGIQVDEDGDADMLSTRSGQISSEEEGEELTLSSSDLRLLRAEDSLSWVKHCSAPAQATGKIKSLAEEIVFDNATDIKRFVALTVQIMEQNSESSQLLLSLWDAYTKKSAAKEVVAIIDSLCSLSETMPTAKQILDTLLETDITLLAPMVEQSKSMLKTIQKLLQLESINRERLVPLLKSLPISDARSTLLDSLSKSGVDMTEFYLGNLHSDKEEVVVDALQALGNIGSEAALIAIGSALGHSLGQVRLEALKSLQERFVPALQKPLLRLLKDPDQDLRLAALAVLKHSQERGLGSALLTILKEKDFLKRPMEEQGMFFTELARFPNASTMGFFRDILSEKNITRNSIVQQRQLLAVQSLGELGTEDAKGILKKFEKSWHLPATVKDAIKSNLS